MRIIGSGEENGKCLALQGGTRKGNAAEMVQSESNRVNQTYGPRSCAARARSRPASALLPVRS